MSFYAEYVLEREDVSTYEDNRGFFTYKPVDKVFYVHDLYITPKFRGTGASEDYANEIEKLAQEFECKKIICTVCPWANNWKISKAYIEKNGYTFIEIKDKLVYFSKEL